MTREEAISNLQRLKQAYIDRHTSSDMKKKYCKDDIASYDMAINSLKVDEMYDLAMETPERLFTKKEIDDVIERIEIVICEEEENTLIALGMANAITILNQKLGIGDKE